MQAQCKMCGGLNTFDEAQKSILCAYCGNEVTVPHVADERIASLYNRANELRLAQEFDKAQMIYESIVQERPQDAEAFFNIALCRFGVEYVEDPRTRERKPTLHRMQFTSILTDENYLHALSYADPIARRLYEKDGDIIDGIQKEYLKISDQEKPFDVFICYKEKDDATGERTVDSVYAQEIYDALVREGYKVFFARITLEDKLGVAYEPYIFSALNSAKVMLVVGTSEAHMQARWVRNEWRRFLYLIHSDPARRLVPVYRDMDPADMPQEFAYLQAQDYGKIGALQDLIHGVKKIIGAKRRRSQIPDEAPSSGRIPEGSSSGSYNALLRRAALFLEDGDFNSARQYYDRVLDQDPECAEAYMGKAACTYQVKKLSHLSRVGKDISQNPDVIKALRFAGDQQRATYQKWISDGSKRIAYQQAAKRVGLDKLEKENAAESLRQRKNAGMSADIAASAYSEAAKAFDKLEDFADAQQCASLCRKLAAIAKTTDAFTAACAKHDVACAGLHGKANPSLSAILAAAEAFEAIEDFKPAQEQAEKLRALYDERLASECHQLHKQIWNNTSYDEQRFRSYAQLIRELPQDDERVQKLARDLEDCKRRLQGKWLPDDDGEVPGDNISDTSFDKHTLSRADVERECNRIAKELKKEKTYVPMIFSRYRERIAALPQDYSCVKTLKEEYERTCARLKDGKKKKRGCLHSLFFRLLILAALIFSFFYFDWATAILRQLPPSVYNNKTVRSAYLSIRNVTYDLYRTLGTPQALFNDVRLKLYDLTEAYFPQLSGHLKLSGAELASAKLSDGDYHGAALAYQDAGMLAQAYQLRSEHLKQYRVAAGDTHVLHLQNNGTVSGTGSKKLLDTASWTNVVAVAASDNYSVGLKRDGTVQTLSKLLSVDSSTQKWTDIVSVAAGDFHVVGLREDGTVVAAGLNSHDQCAVEGWTDVVAIAAGNLFTVGLKRDGTLLVAGSYASVTSSISSSLWKDIVAIDASDYYIVGLKRNGSAVWQGKDSPSGTVQNFGDNKIVSVSAGSNQVAFMLDNGKYATNLDSSMTGRNLVNATAESGFITLFANTGSTEIVGSYNY